MPRTFWSTMRLPGASRAEDFGTCERQQQLCLGSSAGTAQGTRCSHQRQTHSSISYCVGLFLWKLAENSKDKERVPVLLRLSPCRELPSGLSCSQHQNYETRRAQPRGRRETGRIGAGLRSTSGVNQGLSKENLEPQNGDSSGNGFCKCSWLK